jgi:2-phospho-L-lactate guanylyltransferase
MIRRPPRPAAVWALLPVKRLRAAKSRLSPVLDAERRAQLQLAMLADVLDALAEVRALDRILVLSDDPAVHDLALSHDAEILAGPETAAGLNEAVAAGLARLAGARPEALAVFPADIPWAEPEEIALALDTARRTGRATILPDRRHAGTNGAVLPGAEARPLSFGPGSYARHLSLPWRRPPLGLFLPSIARDVDRPGDLAGFAGSRRARETGLFLRRHPDAAGLRPATGERRCR